MSISTKISDRYVDVEKTIYLFEIVINELSHVGFSISYDELVKRMQ